MDQKWCFVKDNDAHKYLIKFEDRDKFYELLDQLEKSDYMDESINKEFDMLIGDGRSLAEGIEYFYLEESQTVL